ncbi:MAG: hypothetical protein Q7S08_02385 [bacterium]|nr:hypothetical protein [bacterium]
MNKNPVWNAITAAVYIIAIASALYFGPKFTGRVDNVLVPITMLSLLVLSASIMGYLFLSRPFQLYLDGDNQGAVGVFTKTVAYFASITLIFLVGLFFISSKI